MFCTELQELLKPIYDLTRKGRPFFMGKEQQDAFEEIKNRMQKPPVLSMPNRKEDSYCILTPTKLQQAVHYINFKMENPGLLLM